MRHICSPVAVSASLSNWQIAHGLKLNQAVKKVPLKPEKGQTTLNFSGQANGKVWTLSSSTCGLFLLKKWWRLQAHKTCSSYRELAIRAFSYSFGNMARGTWIGNFAKFCSELRIIVLKFVGNKHDKVILIVFRTFTLAFLLSISLTFPLRKHFLLL